MSPCLVSKTLKPQKEDDPYGDFPQSWPLKSSNLSSIHNISFGGNYLHSWEKPIARVYIYIEDSGACEADLLTAHPRPTLGQTTSNPQWFRFPIEVAISAGLDTPNHIAPSLSAEIKSKIDASCIEKPFSDKDHISPYKIFLR